MKLAQLWKRGLSTHVKTPGLLGPGKACRSVVREDGTANGAVGCAGLLLFPAKVPGPVPVEKAAGTVFFHFRKLALLIRSQYLVEGSLRLGMRRGGLRHEVANGVRRLLDTRRVVALNGVLQVLVRGLHAAMHRLFRGGRIGEDGEGLLLLLGRKRQLVRQELHPMLGARGRVRRIWRSRGVRRFLCIKK